MRGRRIGGNRKEYHDGDHHISSLRSDSRKWVRTIRNLPDHDKEYKGARLGDKWTDPSPLGMQGGVEQEDDDSRQIEITDHSQVEFTEQFQFLNIPGR